MPTGLNLGKDLYVHLPERALYCEAEEEEAGNLSARGESAVTLFFLS